MSKNDIEPLPVVHGTKKKLKDLKRESGYSGFDIFTFHVMSLLLFNIACEKGILLPTCWPYIQKFGRSEEALGYVQASFPLGKAFTAMFLGYWSDRWGMREPLLLALLVAILGNLLYGLAGHFECFWLLPLGRFLTGMGAGNQPFIYKYITYAPASSRLSYSNLVTSLYLVGLIVSPALNLIFPFLSFGFGIFEFTPLTWGGYFPALINIFLFIILSFRFREPSYRPRYEPESRESIVSLYYHTGAYFHIILIFCVGFLVMYIENSISPIAITYLDFDVTSVSFIFVGVGLTMLVGSIGMREATRRDITPITTLQISIGSGLVTFLLVQVFCTHFRFPIFLLLSLFVFFLFIFTSYVASMGLHTILVGDSCAVGMCMALSAYSQMFGEVMGALSLGNILDDYPSLFYVPCLVLCTLLIVSFYFAQTKMHEKYEEKLYDIPDEEETLRLLDHLSHGQSSIF